MALRMHYIPEWAEHRHMRQVDIVEALDGRVDKSTVSRWFKGALPEAGHLMALQGLFALDEPAALFRHPDDDWIATFFRRRSNEERYQMRKMLEEKLPLRRA